MKQYKLSSLPGTFLMVLLVCILGACSKSPDTNTGYNPPPLQMPSLPIKAIRMLDHSKGWALTEQNILFTSDGGQNWKDVTPSGSVYGKYAYGDFLNEKYAWVVSTAKPIDNTVNVLGTSDGGQHWQSSTISVSEVSLLDYPHFLTTQEGFLELGIGNLGVGSQQAVGIFHTTDGGQHWTEISNIGLTNANEAIGYKTGITFKDAYTGWATGGDASATPWLYVTHDGGHSWSQQSLPNLPGAINTTTTPPVFLGNTGFLPAEIVVSGVAQGHVMAAWETTDGGATWTIIQPEHASGNNNTGFVTGDDLYIADVHHAWGTDPSGDVWGTSDGFNNWSLLAPTVGFIRALSFVDPSYGWAISDTKLLHTIDGGKTWNEIVYHITA